MNKIEQFKNELIKRVQERDENDYVTISQDMVLHSYNSLDWW